MTVALFYNKACDVCKNQEQGLERIEDKLNHFGVRFVKLDILHFYSDIKKMTGGKEGKGWKVDSVPTIMMWVRGGINVVYQFEKDGNYFSQINGYQDPDLLFKKIAGLLKEHG